jgi:hypothetical protein
VQVVCDVVYLPALDVTAAGIADHRLGARLRLSATASQPTTASVSAGRGVVVASALAKRNPPSDVMEFVSLRPARTIGVLDRDLDGVVDGAALATAIDLGHLFGAVDQTRSRGVPPDIRRRHKSAALAACLYANRLLRSVGAAHELVTLSQNAPLAVICVFGKGDSGHGLRASKVNHRADVPQRVLFGVEFTDLVAAPKVHKFKVRHRDRSLASVALL